MRTHNNIQPLYSKTRDEETHNNIQPLYSKTCDEDTQ